MKRPLKLRSEILFNLVVIVIFSMLLLSLMGLIFFRNLIAKQLKDEHNLYAGGIESFFRMSMKGHPGNEMNFLLSSYLKELQALGSGIAFKLFDLSSDNPRIVFSLENSGKIDSVLEDKLKEALLDGKTSTKVEYSNILGLVKKLEGIETFVILKQSRVKSYIVLMTGGQLKDTGFHTAKAMMMVYTVIFALIFLVFGYVLLSRSVVRPLEKIAYEASSIAKGDLETVIETASQNEIGELARAIRSMTETLISNQRKLKDNLSNLERLNRALNDAQMEIVRTEKLASVGRLSSGIAHEIGNPLSAVIGYVGILKKGSSGEGLELLTRSENELQRISRIIRQLLDFSRPAKPEIKQCNLNVCIQNSIDGMEATGKLNGVDVTFLPDPGIQEVLIDENQLRQILLNLLMNATDAIKEKHKKGGGLIKVAAEKTVTRKLKMDSFFIFNKGRRKEDANDMFSVKGRMKGRKDDPPDARLFKHRSDPLGLPRFLFDENEDLIKITVEDNGIGIKPEDIQKIFDPFYTSKEPGQGTGLGLYMTVSSVEAIGGYIDVASSFNEGTLFMLLIPARGFC